MGELVNLEAVRSKRRYKGAAICCACSSEFIVDVPEPCGPAEQKELECYACGHRGGMVIPQYRLVDGFIIYDRHDMPPMFEAVDEVEVMHAFGMGSGEEEE